MNITIFALLILAITGIIIIKMINKEIPIIIKTQKKKWEIQEENKKKIEKFKEKEEKKIESITNEREKKIFKKNNEERINTKKEQPINMYETIKIEKTKKEIFKENRKERYKNLQEQNKIKGKNYEKQISNYFTEKNYKVKEHGIIHGRKDKGIDLIVMKNKEITLIQCKNWKKDSRKKINHVMIKEFLGNCAVFVEKNKDKAKNYKIKKLYIVSNDILENNAKKYIKENKEIIEFKIIPYKEII